MTVCTHKNTSENVHLEKFSNDLSYISIPDALLRYHRDSIFSSWQALEMQLSQVDPVEDPEIYHALNDRVNTLFEAWMMFRYVREAV